MKPDDREWLAEFEREVQAQLAGPMPPAAPLELVSSPDWYKIAEELRLCQEEIATLRAELDRLRLADAGPPAPPKLG